MYECFVYVDVSITCMSGAYSGQKRVLDPLELELQMDVSHHMDVGNYTQIFCTSNRCTIAELPLQP